MANYTYYAALMRRLPYGVARRLTQKRCHAYATIVPHVAGKKGLEIGGPSEIFTGRHLVPVYNKCGMIDTCNFSSQTIWHTSSQNKKFGRHFGKQFVAEACDLSAIPDEAYDFVAASHVVEHLANPLRAVQEWKRVLKPDGALLVIAPYKYVTFDRRRSFTAFEHIEADFRASVSEGDLTHVDEILTLHDLSLDPGAGTAQQFRERCARNASVRAMHHHVFSPDVLVSIFDWLRMRVLNVIERPFHIVAFAQKDDGTNYEQVRLNNEKFLGSGAEWRRRDPFRHLRQAEKSN